ncbi:hypothetical protein L596_027730 [Steinernema carpocapsae]|uniref:G-protein coupled receptors family 1 profile domain-containing protein n=1 Tax=Steinernema carpocapsae TaxID=34508 RepID=A0A4U5LWE0_STECR|nr:hypothetical protein L596_027730 [Steinernema carpocapsae]
MAPALPYIALAEYIAVILLGTLTVAISTVSLLSTQVAWKQRSLQTPNRMMGLFTATAMAMTGTNAVQMVYMAAQWNPYKHEHDTTLMRYLGTVSLITVNSYEITTLLLTADRCVFVLWPAQRLKHEKFFFLFNCAAIGICVVLVSYMGVVDKIPPKLPDNCWAYGCVFSMVTNEILLAVRISLSSSNILLNITFLCLLLKYRKCKLRNRSAMQKFTNHFIIWLFSFHVVFDLSPAIIDLLLRSLKEIYLQNYLGPYGVLFITIDGFFSAVAYNRVLRKIRKVRDIRGQQSQVG